MERICGMKYRKVICVFFILIFTLGMNAGVLAKDFGLTSEYEGEEDQDKTKQKTGVLQPMKAFIQSSVVVIEKSGQTISSNNRKVVWKEYSKYGDGITLTDYAGVTRKELLECLNKNHDSYLGTAFCVNYSDSNEKMNCEGFVERVLRDAGNKKPIARAEGGVGWINVLRNNNIKYRTYMSEDFTALADVIVNDGYAQPGDIIWLWDGGDNDENYRDIDFVGLPSISANDHHIGIYVGNYFSRKNWAGNIRGKFCRNGFWHSINPENSMTLLKSKSSNCKYATVIKLANSYGELKIVKRGRRNFKDIASINLKSEGLPGVLGAEYVVFSKDDFPENRVYWDESSPTLANHLKNNNYGSYEEIKKLDGRITFERYVTIDKLDEKGNAYGVCDGISPGVYFVMETKPPLGYEIDKNIYVATVGPEERVEDNSAVVIESVDDYIYRYGKVMIEKICEEYSEDNESWIKKEECLEGISFGIYAGEDITIGEKNITYNKDSLIETVITDEQGIARSTIELPEGKYYVKEAVDLDTYYDIDNQEFNIDFSQLKDDSKELLVNLKFINKKRIEIKTLLSESEYRTHMGYEENQLKLIDTISYKNMDLDKEYTIKGELRDKETGDVLIVNDSEITCEMEIKPNRPEGIIEVLYEFDASGMAGKSVVAFEYIYDSEGNLVAEHSDINDEKQTIKFPYIETEATSKEGQKEIECAQNVNINDKVYYRNLSPEYTYELSGALMLKSTSKPVLNNGKPVVKSVSFTPENEDGEVVVSFEFDSREYDGQEIVVFESLYLIVESPVDNTEEGLASDSDAHDENVTIGTAIAEHCLIDDMSQTVKVSKKIEEVEETTTEQVRTEEYYTEEPTTEETKVKGIEEIKNNAQEKPKTGDKSPIYPIMTLALTSLVTLIYAYMRKRAKSKK